MNNRCEVALVVPTIRQNCMVDFFNRWDEIGLFRNVDLIIMEDNPHKTFMLDVTNRVEVEHLSWEDINRHLGDRSWVIPRRSDTVRSFAYWYAANIKGYEYIMTLDDDCYPCGEQDGLKYDGAGFVKAHRDYLDGRGRWFNTLNSVKPRGIPFYNLGKNDKVKVNHGLWTNVLDYDAPFQLANPIPEQFSYDNRIVPAGLYFPMCGMNVMWKAEATPLMYHLLMGQELVKMTDVGPHLEKYPFDRFGDIWAGIFMKKIADGMGWQVSTGMPYIRHERASNPFTNLKKEANGIEVNERLWEHVDQLQVCSNVSASENYYNLGKHIARFREYKEHLSYFEKLGAAMQQWAMMFDPSVEVEDI